MGKPTFLTPAGTVSGNFRDVGGSRISVYRAIPVAETAAFGAPRSPEPWGEALDCADTATRRSLLLPTTVSVFAPADADPASLPVIAWIHGGKYEEGHGDDGWYDGGALAAQGCVVVTLNYRLRLEGFLPLDGDAPGSFRGVDDLIHALRWIQDTVSTIGGDPNRVTLIGQSAGGGLIMALLTDRRADQLFQQAAVLSPGLPRILPRIGWRLRRALIRRVLNVPLTRERLSAVDEKERDSAYWKLARRYFSDCPVGPGPLDLSQLREVPLLVSTMEDELVRFPGVAEAEAKVRQRRFPGLMLSLSMLGLGVPWRTLPQWRDHVDPDQPLGRTLSDTMIRRWAAALLEAAPGDQVWSCEFQGGDWRGERIDAQHCGELPLLFDTLSVGREQVDTYCGPDAAERLSGTGERFRAAVLSFARGDSPGWTPYSANRSTHIFNLTGGTDYSTEDPLREIRTLLPVNGT